jgi:CheY-like chemotaxis protein
MSEELEMRPCEPFLTPQEPDQGTGLGRSVVDTGGQRAGGSVQIDSALGKDTAAAEAKDSGQAREAASAALLRGSVLVVEDNDGVRGFVTGSLRAAGLTVDEAGDGASALAALQRDDEVDLLLTDVGLPRMTGPDLAREALRLRPKLRVAFTSGYGGERLQGLVDSGAPLLAKPFSRHQLLEFVRQNLR